MPDLLRGGVAEIRSGGWRLDSWEEVETRVDRGRRFTFGTMRYRDETGAPAAVEVVVKTYKKDPGDRSLRAMEHLWNRGFRAPSHYRVPRPLGRVPGRYVLIQERVRGAPWSEVFEKVSRADRNVSAGAARWLVRLHSSPATRSPEKVLGSIPPASRPRSSARLSADLLAGFPGRAARMEAAVGWLLERLPGAGEPVPSHGDYHPENVFISSGAVAAIDFDNFGAREAGYDVGYAIGQLLIMSRLRSGDFAAGAQAAAEFWKCYAKEGTAPPDRIGVHVARTFLQSLHYELVVLKNGRVDLIEPWTEQMERWLQSEGPETLEDLIRHS